MKTIAQHGTQHSNATTGRRTAVRDSSAPHPLRTIKSSPIGTILGSERINEAVRSVLFGRKGGGKTALGGAARGKASSRPTRKSGGKEAVNASTRTPSRKRG